MRLGLQGQNLTLQKLNETAVSLGLPSNQSFINRRIARAYDLVATNKVSEIDDGIFRVRSQYEPDKSYIVNLNHGDPSCDCPDGERTVNCKHRIAALLYGQKPWRERCTTAFKAQAIRIIKTTDGEAGDYWRRCWLIAQGNSRPVVYEERLRRLFCNCGAHYGDCEHKQLVIQTVTKELKEKRIVNECGSQEAKALQDKLNNQFDSQGNNNNGAQNNAPSLQLDLSNPFEESESYDIDQIEGRRNGEVTWKLRNGEVVISYKGIMTLAEKHGIEFVETAINEDTNTVIAKAKNERARCDASGRRRLLQRSTTPSPSERVSGKPINDGLVDTAMELAKRNAARQLLPLAEIKAIEHKAKLESEFNWQVAKAKCVELIGEANVGIIIHELVRDGKLRPDNPSHYDRTEWLLIHAACEKDASVPRDPKSLNRWSRNSADFIETCLSAIAKVRESKKEANEMPLQTEVKRKLQMDKKLKTWLIESDGTKKPISCREICEKFESKEKGIITRLRAGVDSGADISTVELDD